MKYKLAVLTSHPIPYQIPIFRKLSDNPDIDLTVYFCWDFGTGSAKLDSGFNVKFKWDIPLLEGYHYKFLTNLSLKPNNTFLGEINPGIIPEIWRNHYQAILVHGYSTLSAWFAFLAAWFNKTPILLQGEAHLLNYRPIWKKVFKKILLNTLFRKITAFLAIGALNKQYYLYYEVPEEKIFYVPYIADHDFLNQQKEKWEKHNGKIREELGINQNSVVILYAGKIFGAKGPGALDLLKAFERIRDGRLTNLIFVGDGSKRVFLEDYVKKQRISDVLFTGFKNQTELPKYYSIADVFVLPSYREQWGIAINEAMYFGAAIIASDQVGAAYDLVQEGRNGYIFPAGDINTLAGLLRKMIEDKKMREAMKLESEKIIQHWNLEVCALGMLDALCFANKKCINRYEARGWE